MPSAAELFDRTARDYDRTRRQLVPCFDHFYGALLDALHFAADDTVRVLDLGSGTGLAAALVGARFAGAQLTLVDAAPQMIDLARQRFAGAAHATRFVVADYSAFEPDERYDAVISALSIHHLDAAQKQRLFGRVRDWLRPGGIFVNADQIAGASAAEDAGNRRQWLAEARAAGVSEADLDMAQQRMREDRPDTIAAQLDWLAEAGLADVRCPYQHSMFAVFAARK